jgi:hypothetical protein
LIVQGLRIVERLACGSHNLETILDLVGSQQLLQMAAIEILTELVLVPSINISMETRGKLSSRSSC